MAARLSNTALGRSTIDGVGVFAARDIRRGERIDEDISDVIGFNHSCTANVASRKSRGHVCVATRTVYVGEELTVFYPAKSKARSPFGKHCGCPKCQSRIRGARRYKTQDEALKELAKQWVAVLTDPRKDPTSRTQAVIAITKEAFGIVDRAEARRV